MPESLKERFDWMCFAFDVSACEEAIDAGTVKFAKTSFERAFIGAYAYQLLGLHREMPDDAITSALMRIDVGAARLMGPTAEARPVLLVETEPGKGVVHLAGKSYFLVNGNHRMARAYFEDAEDIGARIVALDAAAPFIL